MGTIDRYQVDQYIAYLVANVNPLIDELTMPNLAKEVQVHFRVSLSAAIASLEADFQGGQRAYAVGSKFTTADIYLFMVLNKLSTVRVEFSSLRYAYLYDYFLLIATREEVKAAIKHMETNPSTTCDNVGSKCCWA